MNIYKLLVNYQVDEEQMWGMIHIYVKKAGNKNFEEVFTITTAQFERWGLSLNNFDDDEIIKIRLKMAEDSRDHNQDY